MPYRTEHHGPARNFKISFGLRTGYEKGAEEAESSAVIEAIKVWIAERITAEAKYVTGTLTLGQLAYGWPEDDGPVTCDEPGFTFSGVFHPTFSKDVSDEDGWKILEDLASVIGEKFGQSRVWVEFVGEVKVLEKVD